MCARTMCKQQWSAASRFSRTPAALLPLHLGNGPNRGRYLSSYLSFPSNCEEKGAEGLALSASASSGRGRAEAAPRYMLVLSIAQTFPSSHHGHHGHPYDSEPPLELEEWLAAAVLLAIAVSALCHCCCFLLKPSKGGRAVPMPPSQALPSKTARHAPAETARHAPEIGADALEDELSAALRREAALDAALSRVRHRTARLKKKLGTGAAEASDAGTGKSGATPACTPPKESASRVEARTKEAAAAPGKEEAVLAEGAFAGAMALTVAAKADGSMAYKSATAAALHELAVRSALEAAEAQAAAAAALADAAAAREEAMRAAMQAAGKLSAAPEDGIAGWEWDADAEQSWDADTGEGDSNEQSAAGEQSSLAELEGDGVGEPEEAAAPSLSHCDGPWIPLADFVGDPFSLAHEEAITHPSTADDLPVDAGRGE